MAAAAAHTSGVGTIRDGDNAILDINGDQKTFVVVKKNGKVKVGKSYCSLAPLIGQSYGIQFDIPADGEVIELKKARVAGEGPALEWAQWEAADGTGGRNNSQLLDGGQSHQGLSREDIEAMKVAGVGGQAILEALACNSATFGSKTQYAQEKYRKRKAKKYCATATLLRPSGAALAEAYFGKSPGKVHHLRADALAVLLAAANIGAHARVLAFDACAGLVTGAVAERLGGHGLVVSAFVGPNLPSMAAVRQFNFAPEVRASISVTPMRELLQCRRASGGAAAAQDAARAEPAAAEELAAAGARAGQLPGAGVGQGGGAEQGLGTDGNSSGHGGAAAAEGAASPAQAAAPLADETAAEQGSAGASGQAGPAAGEGSLAGAAAAAAGPSMEEDAGHAAGAAACNGAAAAAPQQNGCALPAPQVARSAQQGAGGSGRAPLPEPVQQACREGFGCCVLAAPAVQPLALLRGALPLLAPSACFAIFHNCVQPLAECMQQLQASKQAVALQLQEPWWREHQVLPARTHPKMQGSGTGGYLLSGIIVARE